MKNFLLLFPLPARSRARDGIRLKQELRIALSSFSSSPLPIGLWGGGGREGSSFFFFFFFFSAMDLFFSSLLKASTLYARGAYHTPFPFPPLLPILPYWPAMPARVRAFITISTQAIFPFSSPYSPPQIGLLSRRRALIQHLIIFFFFPFSLLPSLTAMAA